MAETQEDICSNSELSANLEKMLNNKRYSDTVFLVNKRKFYASSHLLSVSSVELESILETHHENCGDREIKIGDVKYNESFPLILRFIYGLDINMPQLSKLVLCEVLTLAERFELKSLASKLKSFLSKLECFEIDFVIVLLNTAKKFQMMDLYEKSKFFAFENADQVVRHESFADLQYDVLLDLVKANLFCADEIDILKGVLNWHSNNMSESPSIENDIKNVSDENTDKEDDVEDEGKDMEEKIEEEPDSSNIKNNDKVDNEKNQPAVKTEELVKEFSTNVLKNLLSHIRFTRILAVDLFKLMETGLYSQFKEFLCDPKYFSPNTEARGQYVATPPAPPPSQYLEKNFTNVSKIFTVNCAQQGVIKESNEEYVIGDMKWKISMQDKVENNYNNSVRVYMKCTLSDQLLLGKEWKCKAECQIKMFPINTTCTTGYTSPIQYLPNENKYLSVELTSQNSTDDFGNLYYSNAVWGYKENQTSKYTFEVNFKSVHSQVKIEE